jgi:predicted  nucleic acid-binding Zn-ribbon protein
MYKKKENKPLPLSEVPLYLDQMILEKDGLKQEINDSKIALRDLNNTQGQIINRIQDIYNRSLA